MGTTNEALLLSSTNGSRIDRHSAVRHVVAVLSIFVSEPSYCSGVCLETGYVEWMGLDGNCVAETSAAFLDLFRQRHSEQSQ